MQGTRPVCVYHLGKCERLHCAVMDSLEPLSLNEIPVTVLQMEVEYSRESATKPEAKAAALQIEYMVDYLDRYPYVAVKKFRKRNIYKNSTASWKQLTNQLNNMCSRTVINDVKSWKAIWRQEQKKVLRKLEKMEANQAGTGSVDGPEVELTFQDRKILRLLHLESVDEMKFESADAPQEELWKASEFNTEQQKDIQEINPTGCISNNSSDTESIRSDIFDTLDLLLDGIDDTKLAMMVTDSMLGLGTPLQPALEFELPTAPLDEPCLSSQQNPPFPTPSVGAFAPPEHWQPWSTYPLSCVPAEVEIPVVAESCQTPSCEQPSHTVPLPVEAPAPLDEPCLPSQQNSSFPTLNVGAFAPPEHWQPWSTYPLSCVPAEVEIPAVAESCQTPSCEQPSHTVPLPVEAPAPLDEPCLPSQQNPPFPTLSVGALAPPKHWQPWSTYPLPCVPAEVEIPALPDPCQTSSCEKPSHTVPLPVEAPAPLDEPYPPSQQNPPFPALRVGALAPPVHWQLWSAFLSACESPMSCKVSHSLNGPRSSVQPKRIASVTKYTRKRSRLLRDLEKQVAIFTGQQKSRAEKIAKLRKQIADLEYLPPELPPTVRKSHA